MSETLLRLTRLLACVAHHASTVARKNASEPKGAPTTHELSLKQAPETSQAPQFGQSDHQPNSHHMGPTFLPSGHHAGITHGHCPLFVNQSPPAQTGCWTPVGVLYVCISSVF